MKLIVSCARAENYAQDARDYETMRALISQRAAYPKTYNAVRDAVACNRHNTAYDMIKRIASDGRY